MKLIAVNAILLVVFVAGAMSGDSSATDMFSKKMEGFKEECQKIFKISPQEESAMKFGQAPKTDDGKGFVGCVFEKIGVIKNGKYDTDAAKQIAKEQLGGEKEKYDLAIKIIEACGKDVQTTESKETGPAILTCTATKYAEFNGQQQK